MRRYESIIVFDPKLSEAQLKEESDKVTAIIASNKGLNVTTDSWGKRELPYLMKKNLQGQYVVFYFESANGDVVKELQSQLRITESVIKFQTHKIQDRIRKFRGRAQRVEEDSSAAAEA